MRLFLGSFTTINHYDAIKKDFSMLQARWMPEQNIHLTYLFLGDKHKPENIIHKLQKIKYPKTTIPIIGLGTFGKPAHILYANARNEVLFHLHNEIVHRLNIKPEKPFIPHITLARIKKVENVSALRELIESYQKKVLGTMQLEVKLVASKLTPKGALYKKIYDF